eukprot:s5523_g1.t1
MEAAGAAEETCWCDEICRLRALGRRIGFTQPDGESGPTGIWKLAGYKDVNRDEAGTIQRRFLSAILSCICSVLLVRLLAQRLPDDVPGGLFLSELLGLRSAYFMIACINCLLLTASLFLGPLAQHGFIVLQGESKLFFSVEG